MRSSRTSAATRSIPLRLFLVLAVVTVPGHVSSQAVVQTAQDEVQREVSRRVSDAVVQSVSAGLSTLGALKEKETPPPLPNGQMWIKPTWTHISEDGNTPTFDTDVTLLPFGADRRVDLFGAPDGSNPLLLVGLSGLLGRVDTDFGAGLGVPDTQSDLFGIGSYAVLIFPRTPYRLKALAGYTLNDGPTNLSSVTGEGTFWYFKEFLPLIIDARLVYRYQHDRRHGAAGGRSTQTLAVPARLEFQSNSGMRIYASGEYETRTESGDTRGESQALFLGGGLVYKTKLRGAPLEFDASFRVETLNDNIDTSTGSLKIKLTY